MPKADSDPQYCVHGMRREHVVSGGGSTCNGPFRWVMSRAEAVSVSAYYFEYETFYNRTSGK